MASDYKIYPDDNLIVTIFSGTFTVEDILQLRQRIQQDSEYRADYSVIDDVTRVEEVDADFTRMLPVTSGIIIKRGIRRALVAKTDLQFGMARTYQLLSESEGHMFKVLRDYDKALAWIRLPISEKE